MSLCLLILFYLPRLLSSLPLSFPCSLLFYRCTARAAAAAAATAAAMFSFEDALFEKFILLFARAGFWVGAEGPKQRFRLGALILIGTVLLAAFLPGIVVIEEENEISELCASRRSSGREKGAGEREKRERKHT